MREPTAASHFTRNMFQSLAEEFLFDYLPDIIFSFVSHPPDIGYIQIYIFDTNKLSKVSNQYVLPNIIVRCDLQMCKIPNCQRLLPTLRCRYSWNQGNANIFVWWYLSTLELCLSKYLPRLTSPRCLAARCWWWTWPASAATLTPTTEASRGSTTSSATATSSPCWVSGQC